MATASRYPSSNSGSWTSGGNLYADDGSYATCAPLKNGTVDHVVGGFNLLDYVPSDATISRVDVTVGFYVSTTSSAAEMRIVALVNGTVEGTYASNTAEPTSETTLTKSYTSGKLLTRSNLDNGVFTVKITGRRGSSSTAVTFYADYVLVTVTYTVPTYKDGTVQVDAVSTVTATAILVKPATAQADAISTASAQAIAIRQALASADAVATTGASAELILMATAQANAVSTAGALGGLVLNGSIRADAVSTTQANVQRILEALAAADAVSETGVTGTLLVGTTAAADAMSTAEASGILVRLLSAVADAISTAYAEAEVYQPNPGVVIARWKSGGQLLIKGVLLEGESQTRHRYVGNLEVSGELVEDADHGFNQGDVHATEFDEEVTF